MAKRQTKPVQSAHKCADCTFAKLLRGGNDPVIAECTVKNGERFVANATTYCSEWEGRD